MTDRAGLTGVLFLWRVALRRDRWMIMWWSVGSALVFWSQGAAMAGLYDTQAELDRAAGSLESNTAFVAMLGPPRGLDTVGGEAFWQSSGFCAVLAGLMCMFIIGRHTRAEEESGRDELLRSGVIGRRAPLVAAFGIALVASAVMGAATTVGLLTLRGDSPLKGMPLPVADSIATGVGLAAVGAVFAGSALVAVQLSASTRTAYGVAGVVLGVSYLLRAVGDVGNGVASWLSPIGWYQAMYPFSGLRWWPLALLLLAAVLLAAAALALFDRRDVGAGLWAARPGPAEGGSGLRSALGLAWRLQRGSVVGWSLGLVLTGIAYGSMGDSVDDLIGDSDFAQDAVAGGASDLVDGFYGTALVTMALLACGFAVSSATRPRGEEQSSRLELLLAAGSDRSAWLAGHVLVTLVGSVLVLVGGGVALGVGYGATTGDWGEVGRYAGISLTYLAPVLVLSGLARLLYGIAPSLMWLSWLALTWCVVVLMFAAALQMPEWLQALSPFDHLSLAPAEDVDLVPVLVVGAVGVVASLAGQFAFRRRDIG